MPSSLHIFQGPTKRQEEGDTSASVFRRVKLQLSLTAQCSTIPVDAGTEQRGPRGRRLLHPSSPRGCSRKEGGHPRSSDRPNEGPVDGAGFPQTQPLRQEFESKWLIWEVIPGKRLGRNAGQGRKSGHFPVWVTGPSALGNLWDTV